jgi:hypothetical protein
MCNLDEFTDEELKIEYTKSSRDKEILYDEWNSAVKYCYEVREELKKRKIDVF